MKSKKRLIVLLILLILQTVIYIFVGVNKPYLHIDEAYSFGLTNYDKIEITDNEDFFDNWHNKEYYEDYLSLQEDEVGDWTPVYENQKNDVHPPLYYLFLRIAMTITQGHFSKWSGFGLNIIIYAFVTIFMYLILKKLLKNEKNAEVKSAVLAFVSSIVLASLSNVIYIRMYSLLTLEVLIITFLHIKLLEKEKLDIKLLIGIGSSVLTGVLTHYYYLFYLAVLYIVFLIKYIKAKRKKEALFYTLTMLIAGGVSLLIFPYSIQHMFFGYRGQSVISKLEKISQILPSMKEQMHNLNYYGFNNLLYTILAIIIISLIFIKIRKKRLNKLDKDKKDILEIIIIPSLFFFIIASIASPWNVLRYIVPVCGLIFIIVIYCLYKVIQNIFKEKTVNILIIILLCFVLVSPLIFNMEPELLYAEKKQIVEKLSTELNLPTIYIYKSETSGFLNDILLFSKIDESYIAKDMDCTEENIQNILEGKDVSNGIIVFINDGQDNDSIIETIKNALGYNNCDDITRLWLSTVYYIY